MKVSVITVCYNSSSTIIDTIESVNNQTYKNLEHIFIDGDSNDNTLEIINSNSNSEFLVISEKDNGIYDAMNKGIEKSTGEIIFILNSDDIFYNNSVIDNVVTCFKNDNSLEIVYGHIKMSSFQNIKKIIRIWKTSNYKNNSFLHGWHPPHPGLVVKKSYYNKFGKFNSRLICAADFEFMFRMFHIHKVKSKFLDEFITVMRYGGNSTSIKGVIQTNKDIRQSFLNHGIKKPFLFFTKRYFKKFLEFIT